ncbi:MAG: hypothetical protein EA413_12290 [Cyanobium sp. PLM2.Bin73]|nr:MAG: hypothetical protein EA413_12290 [Cyanobium sp. PLM2.Bin73]
MAAPSPEQLADLSLDLQVEIHKLQRLIGGIQELGPLAEDPLRVDAAALRLQSLYTGIERCLVQISRVLNGGSGEGAEWHRRLLERMGQPTVRRPAVLSPATIADLQELLRFRHLVRHLYAYELRPEPVERLRCQALTVWPRVKVDLERFRRWLATGPGDGDAETRS